MTAKYPKTGLFAGSFNPFTIGHKSIVDRALELFDRVVIAVGVNLSKPCDDLDDRLAAIKAVYAGDSRVAVVSYTGLTVDLCRRLGVTAMIRGVRSVADFEYERNLADVNRNISGIETVILFSLPEQSWLSSSTLRELARYGRDITPYLPKSEK